MNSNWTAPPAPPPTLLIAADAPSAKMHQQHHHLRAVADSPTTTTSTTETDSSSTILRLVCPATLFLAPPHYSFAKCLFSDRCSSCFLCQSARCSNTGSYSDYRPSTAHSLERPTNGSRENALLSTTIFPVDPAHLFGHAGFAHNDFLGQLTILRHVRDFKAYFTIPFSIFRRFSHRSFWREKKWRRHT